MTDVTVTAEPRTYHREGDHSYFADLAIAAVPGHPRHARAQERLLAHANEVRVDARGASPDAARLRRSLLDESRSSFGVADGSVSRQVRALTTQSGSAGAFTVPQYLVDDAVAYRSYGRVFVDQAKPMPLPGSGMLVNVPALTAPAATGIQTEGDAVTEASDPTAAYLSSEVQTAAGQVTASQQLVDRQQDATVDAAINYQLTMAYNTDLDASVIADALAASAAGVVNDAGSLSLSNVWGDVAKAQAQMETAPGVVLPATHTFFPILEWNWLTAQLDSDGRPIIVPRHNGPLTATEPVAEGDCGYSLLGARVFRDGNLPTVALATVDDAATTSGSTTVTCTSAGFTDGDAGQTVTGAGIPAGTTITSVTSPTAVVLSAPATATATGVTVTIAENAQLVVAHMPSVWVLEGEPILRAFPETLAGSLQVVLQRYSYYAVIVAMPAAVVSVSGTAYPVNPNL